MTEKWITEKLLSFISTSLRYQEMLIDEHTDHQHIQVVSTNFFGNVLLLDGAIQLTELDNAGYHEMIVHVPMLAHEKPENVLIIGGGDGGALHQVLRYPVLQQVVVCELDKRVVEVCAQFFPNFGNPFNDEQVHLVIEDAFKYLQITNHKFDVIIADTSDPIGKAEKLFSAEFYRLMVKALTNRKGVVTAQCEQMHYNSSLISRMVGVAKELVQHSAYYHTFVPTYPGGGIGFLYMSDIHWTNGLGKPYPGKMEYLNRDVHEAAFVLPEFFKNLLSG